MCYKSNIVKIRGSRGGKKLKNGIKTLAMWLIIAVIFLVVLSSIVENSNSKLKYSDLIADINSGKVENIELDSDSNTAIVSLKDDKIRKDWNNYLIIAYKYDNIYVFAFE